MAVNTESESFNAADYFVDRNVRQGRGHETAIRTRIRTYTYNDVQKMANKTANALLNLGGIWVSPLEVENTLVSHPAVLECAVVGAPDEKGLVKPRAHVVLAAGREASPALEEELKQHCLDRMAKYKYPRWIVFEKELPKSATGKILRYRLRERAQAGA